ncbi:competence type IV pilus minor pilin ComGF [Bacillus sp. 2205SS5-2]|uniref:competence type IV pilus minor pilin ComGF n=1 Tax=Bacillus sp. 2205SS5-2 TaxID=3109031 RepID=UPI003006FE6A
MFKQNEKGFTFLESLLSFTILLIICSSFSLLLGQMYHLEHQKNTYPHEWHLFMYQLQEEMTNANSITIGDQYVSFSLNGESIRYERYGHFLRRRVNLKGHEVVLQEVSESAFRSITAGANIEIEFKSGERRIGNVYSYVVP